MQRDAPRRAGECAFAARLVRAHAGWPPRTQKAAHAPWLTHSAAARPHAHAQTAVGVHFASYSPRIDRLSVLKTTFQEQLALTGDALPNTPRVVSVVAFRLGDGGLPVHVPRQGAASSRYQPRCCNCSRTG